MRTRRTLFYATLTCALAFITNAYAAPLNEPTATTPAEGLDSTLEISKLGADLSNNIPNEFSSSVGANLQPYASTEVDTVAELASTSLPMTKEEMELAEVAAVVAELATTTAAELKDKEEAKYAGDEAEAEVMAQIWRRAEEAKRQVIAHELANAVDTIEYGGPNDEKDFATATTTASSTTTLRTSFSDTVAATTMSPATTESPQILNELVRAAAAANEILAAALNAANLAVTVTTNNMSTTTAVVANEMTTATTMQSMVATTNTEAGSADGFAGTTAPVSDSEGLSEAVDVTVTWRPKEAEAAASQYAGDGVSEKIATTITSALERANTYTTSNLNILGASSGGKDLKKSAEIQTSTQHDIQETTIAAIIDSKDELLLLQKKYAESIEKMPTSLSTSEAAESVETSKTKEPESKETTTANGNISPLSKELPQEYEASTLNAKNFVAEGEVARAETNIVETANQGVPQAADNDKVFAETQTAKVVEVKQPQVPQIGSQLNERADTITTTASSSLANTIESQETLIAVESEAQTPNRIVSAFVNDREEKATATTPDEITTTENVAPPQPTDSDLRKAETLTTKTSGSEIYSEISLTTTISEPELIKTPSPEHQNTFNIERTSGAPEHQNTFNIETTSKAGQTEDTAKAHSYNLHTTTANSAQTEQSTLSEVGTEEILPITITSTTTELLIAEALENAMDTQGLPTTTASTAEQHEANTKYSAGVEETTTASLKVPISQTTTTVDEEISTNSAERVQETIYSPSFKDDSANGPLAPFTTTPRVIEELIQPRVAMEKTELGASTEMSQTTSEVWPVTTNAADTIETTFSSSSSSSSSGSSSTSGSSNSTETTAMLAAIKPAVTKSNTPTAAEGQLNAETVEPAVEAETLEALVEPVANQATTKSVLIEEQPLYMRTTTETQQWQTYSESESKSTTTTAIKTPEVLSETADTASIPTEADIITTTTSAPEREIITTTTTTTSEPEKSTSVATTKTISKPETTTTTTTTTTLSPMSLIVAEHEARSLDRTPPRVNRFVSEDGVEVLTGYSIVNHIYAAALAALEARGA